MKTNRERLEVIHKINYGVLAVNDPTKERSTVSQDDFFAAFNAQSHAPKEQAPEPPSETPLNASEPVKEPEPLPTPQKSAEEWLKDGPELPQEESHPFTGQYDVKEAPTMLLVDAIATGGESVDLLRELAPWIADIEEKHSRPMCMIPYDEGWKHLGARLASQKTWLFSKNIVTILSLIHI